MNADDDEQQDREWQALYRLVVQTMAQWGVDNAFGKGDYLIVDDTERVTTGRTNVTAPPAN